MVLKVCKSECFHWDEELILIYYASSLKNWKDIKDLSTSFQWKTRSGTSVRIFGACQNQGNPPSPFSLSLRWLSFSLPSLSLFLYLSLSLLCFYPLSPSLFKLFYCSLYEASETLEPRDPPPPAPPEETDVWKLTSHSLISPVLCVLCVFVCVSVILCVNCSHFSLAFIFSYDMLQHTVYCLVSLCEY